MAEPTRPPASTTAPGEVRIARALLSVSDKTGVADLARGLADLGVELVSTGGTARALRDAGLDVRDVSDLTGFPEIMDGRVKTLHPRLHGGLLARRDVAAHLEQAAEQGIEPIDLVVVNLYPFEQTVARRDATDAEVIEDIDIGGPSMIRASAKNHAFTAIVTTPEAYDAVLEELRDTGGSLSMPTREALAADAFACTARYDTAIARWFAEQREDFPALHVRAFEKVTDLSYGENPHQRAAYYELVGARTALLSKVRQHHGKPLSYNNLLDLDAARAQLREFAEDSPACVIVKHGNPCGVATGSTPLEAYERAFACDPLSAYGGIIVFDRDVDEATARRLHEQFVEVLLAPGYGPGAREVLEQKQNIRILEDEERRSSDDAGFEVRQVHGGLLVQDRDLHRDEREGMEVRTVRTPDEREWQDLLVAWRVAKHVRSNAIVLVRDGATIGIGAGQMSRVDSVRLSIEKSQADSLEGAVLASDAFFPFADGPALAIEAGVRAVIQPGGSIRDDEVIAAADEAGVAMVLTHRRHFRH